MEDKYFYRKVKFAKILCFSVILGYLFRGSILIENWETRFKFMTLYRDMSQNFLIEDYDRGQMYSILSRDIIKEKYDSDRELTALE